MRDEGVGQPDEVRVEHIGRSDPREPAAQHRVRSRHRRKPRRRRRIAGGVCEPSAPGAEGVGETDRRHDVHLRDVGQNLRQRVSQHPPDARAREPGVSGRVVDRKDGDGHLSRGHVDRGGSGRRRPARQEDGRQDGGEGPGERHGARNPARARRLERVRGRLAALVSRADLTQLTRHFARGRRPVLRFLAERAVEKDGELARRAGNPLGERRGVVAQDGAERVRDGLPPERVRAGHRLVEDDGGREEIGPAVGAGTSELLGREIPGRAHDDARRRRALVHGRFLVAAEKLREPEVENLHEPVRRDHQVLGLEIPMDDPRFVSLRNPIESLGHEIEGARDGNRTLLDHGPQGRAGDELRDHVRAVLVFADVVDRQDVGMVQRGGRLRLRDEPLQPVAVLERLRRKHLDGDLPAEARIARAIHLAHSAGAEMPQDLVGPYAGAHEEKLSVVSCQLSVSVDRGRATTAPTTDY